MNGQRPLQVIADILGGDTKKLQKQIKSESCKFVLDFRWRTIYNETHHGLKPKPATRAQSHMLVHIKWVYNARAWLNTELWISLSVRQSNCITKEHACVCMWWVGQCCRYCHCCLFGMPATLSCSRFLVAMRNAWWYVVCAVIHGIAFCVRACVCLNAYRVNDNDTLYCVFVGDFWLNSTANSQCTVVNAIQPISQYAYSAPELLSDLTQSKWIRPAMGEIHHCSFSHNDRLKFHISALQGRFCWCSIAANTLGSVLIAPTNPT